MNPKKLMDKAINAFIHMAENPSKETAYRALCLTRASAVRMIVEWDKTGDNKRQFARLAKKMPVPDLPDGVEISIMNPYEQLWKTNRSRIVTIGEILSIALDVWQVYGATLDDLKILCNGGGEHWYRAVEDYQKGDQFSSIVFVGNLDYKEKGDFLRTNPNAPLTTCLLEYNLNLIRTTEHGKRAAHEAIKQIVPELMEKALYRYTDSEGIVHYLDKDGVEVGHEPPKK